jgi:CBS domain-containing protein
MRAKDIMQTDVVTVAPTLSVVALEQLLAREEISGAPVVQGGVILGVVTRADVARAFGAAESGAEATLDYYRHVARAAPDPSAGARMAGERVATMTVRDVMTTQIIAVSPEHPVREIAEALDAGGMHRLLVTDGGRLVGLVTTSDLVRAIADGRLVERDRSG